MKRHISILAFLSLCFLTDAQSTRDNIDSVSVKENPFYTDYTDLLAARLYALVKVNALAISDKESVLTLDPNSPTSIGFGLNYKSFALSLGFGVPTSQASKDKYVDTKRLDLQVSILGEKIAGDGFLQIYKGYFNSNPNDLIEWNEPYFPKVSDLGIISVGLTGSYIFDHKKFSYKAAFLRNQVQEKSAGSFSAGLFAYYDQAVSDNGFVPTEFPDSIQSKIDLKAFRTLTTGVSAGYMHTFVFGKDFFVNLAAVPGIGYRWLGVKNLSDETENKYEFAPQLFGRVALGYEHKYFYIGITASSILRNFEFEQFTYDLATEQFRFFIGKRFNIVN